MTGSRRAALWHTAVRGTLSGVSNREPMTDQTLPATREELLARHAEARHRRDAAELGSDAWRAAAAEIARIEVEIARIERAMDPPRV